MAQNDFFRLQGPLSRLDQDQFYAHLDRADHLCDTLYEPETLDRLDNRTTRLKRKLFERVSFSKTTISDIIFQDCQFTDCLLIGSRILRCEFHNCTFLRTNVYKISIESTYIDPRSFRNSLDPKKHQNIGVHLYQVLMNNARDLEQPEFEADARFLFLRWKRYQEIFEVRRSWAKSKELEPRKRARIATRFLWEWLFGSGIRIRHFVSTTLAMVALITVGNFTFREQLGLHQGEERIVSLIDSLYFSTVTLTTLGFGDITPTTQLGRLFVAAEGAFGFFLFATLASMLFRKIAP